MVSYRAILLDGNHVYDEVEVDVETVDAPLQHHPRRIEVDGEQKTAHYELISMSDYPPNVHYQLYAVTDVTEKDEDDEA
ncbi:hypothetical protein [Leifsonia soli]|uniref:Uncharacterized protein n=1 Tax=Leifsonia soli TaxID=582665 RepID=A0A852T361_9MICO|nr:hypothetical protein [Leifsonia soli]NYD76068.1 hypothetical protein [Leifsonia soli]